MDLGKIINICLSLFNESRKGEGQRTRHFLLMMMFPLMTMIEKMAIRSSPSSHPHSLYPFLCSHIDTLQFGPLSTLSVDTLLYKCSVRGQLDKTHSANPCPSSNLSNCVTERQTGTSRGWIGYVEEEKEDGDTC